LIKPDQQQRCRGRERFSFFFNSTRLGTHSQKSTLLRLAIPLVETHGFTRDALARSVLALPTPHSDPLSETAVDALFGRGNEARKTLINAWLRDGVEQMKATSPMTMKTVLRTRLQRNVPVLNHLPDVSVCRGPSQLFILLKAIYLSGICLAVGSNVRCATARYRASGETRRKYSGRSVSSCMGIFP